jgi:hypothetical protein
MKSELERQMMQLREQLQKSFGTSETIAAQFTVRTQLDEIEDAQTTRPEVVDAAERAVTAPGGHASVQRCDVLLDNIAQNVNGRRSKRPVGAPPVSQTTTTSDPTDLLLQIDRIKEPPST